MVALSVVVRQILVDCSAQVALAEEHELVEALAFDGTNEALGVSVQAGTARGQADRGDAGGGEEGAELGSVERVAVEEQEALAREEAIHAVEKVPGDLQHPSPMGLVNQAVRLLQAAVPILAAFTAPFYTRPDPGEDDFFRSSVHLLIARRTPSEHYGIQAGSGRGRSSAGGRAVPYRRAWSPRRARMRRTKLNPDEFDSPLSTDRKLLPRPDLSVSSRPK
jgi:hypothetical protein